MHLSVLNYLMISIFSGGGAFGISAAVKAGYKGSKDKAKASSNSNDTSVMNISFNVCLDTPVFLPLCRLISHRLSFLGSYSTWTLKTWSYPRSVVTVWSR